MRKKSIFIFLITMIVFTFIFSACTGKQKKLSVISLSSGKEYTLPLKAENILSGGNFRTYIKNYIKNPFELKNGFLCSIRILLMTKIRQIQT